MQAHVNSRGIFQNCLQEFSRSTQIGLPVVESQELRCDDLDVGEGPPSIARIRSTQAKPCHDTILKMSPGPIAGARGDIEHLQALNLHGLGSEQQDSAEEWCYGCSEHNPREQPIQHL